ncbi:MAG: DUF3368 domain-containing protein, partial [Armatimonadetes bacterium]|nr:DUF3368 domain-containing protein [Armatimonadota bacterium]
MHVSEVDAGARPRAAAKLGEGEQDCLALALQMADALLLVDDEGARQCARTLGIAFTGTLGVLLRATEQSLLPSVSPLLDRLQSLGFRVRPTVRAHVLRLAGE